MNIPISREEALELLKKYNQDESDFVHFLESEAVMKHLARKLDENEEEWAMLGLMHDIDWGITKENVSEHLSKAPEILRDAGFDEEFINTVISHGFGFPLPGLEDKERTENIEHALACSETITGLIHAYALMRGKKISDMEVKGLKKKFKDKRFAEAVDRQIIRECEKLGLELDDFFELAISAIKEIKDSVGLS